MATTDPLCDLLAPHLARKEAQPRETNNLQVQASSDSSAKYLSRLLSLRLSDLTTTEPQSLSQSSQSNLISIQALSSRSHRTTTTSSDHLSTLSSSLQSLIDSTKGVREAIPSLDEQAISFASAYSKPRLRENFSRVNHNSYQKDAESTAAAGTNVSSILASRQESQLLTRQGDKLQDILELPNLLSATIASASSSATGAGSSGSSGSGSANYTPALDLFAHIKRLQNIYPDSQLVRSVVAEAETAMKEMTANLVTSLRSQNIRLAAAIRTVGWLRRVVPELSHSTSTFSSSAKTDPTNRPNSISKITSHQDSKVTSAAAVSAATATAQTEGSFGALYLTSRLATFLSMTEALGPLRDLADQETEKRLSHMSSVPTTQVGTTSASSAAGHQTERYLKRYIEIFREQSFSTISTYRQIFPAVPSSSSSLQKEQTGTSGQENEDEDQDISLPPALSQFPLHLVNLLIDTLKMYLPNVSDPATRESLLMQTLYAANSLGRLGADFSLMIATLYEDDNVELNRNAEVDNRGSENTGTLNGVDAKITGPQAGANGTHDPNQGGENNEDTVDEQNQTTNESKGEETIEENEKSQPESEQEPEWVRVIKKHRVQAARLDALAAGKDSTSKRGVAQDDTVAK